MPNEERRQHGRSVTLRSFRSSDQNAPATLFRHWVIETLIRHSNLVILRLHSPSFPHSRIFVVGEFAFVHALHRIAFPVFGDGARGETVAASNNSLSSNGHELHRFGFARLEADGCPRRNVEA